MLIAFFSATSVHTVPSIAISTVAADQSAFFELTCLPVHPHLVLFQHMLLKAFDFMVPTVAFDLLFK